MYNCIYTKLCQISKPKSKLRIKRRIENKRKKVAIDEEKEERRKKKYQEGLQEEKGKKMKVFTFCALFVRFL